MFDTMRIRTKLTVALIIPLLALVGLSGVAIANSRDKADRASAIADNIDSQVELANASIGPAGVLYTLQEERSSESVDLIGYADVLLAGQPGVAENRVSNEKAIADFRAAVASKSQAVQEKYQPALEALDEIPELRKQIDEYPGPRTQADLGTQAFVLEIFDGYTDVIGAVFDANTAVAFSIEDPELRAGSDFIDNLSRYKDLQTIMQRTIGTALTDPAGLGLFGNLELLDTAVRQDADRNLLRDDLLASESATYAALADEMFAQPGLAPAEDTFDRVLAGEVLPVDVLLGDDASQAQEVFRVTSEQAAAQLEADGEALTQAARSEADDASSQALLVTIITGLVLLIAVLVTLIASRSITRPLHRLVGDAEQMAKTSLPNTVKDILDAPLGDDVVMPELVPVSTAGGYEIAEVATALNTVQDSATGLAIEQAVLRRNISDSFVNLGRRNQNLLSRQLDSITEMERSEADPEQLQKLFTLDHLATRMRRNAESLLLLAGLEPHRQWSAPVALIDVLRGALGEVEDYDRVVIERLEEATVSGTNAADLTHLVAELVENALNFSPPGRSVELLGKTQGDGYTLVIIDEGVGMDAEDLAQANLRLSGGESYTVAPSRYLGHYVVGIQAARLGVKVQLQHTPTGGITALIDLTAVLENGDGSSTNGAVPEPDRDITVAGLISEHTAARSASTETSPLSVDVPDTPESIDDEVVPVAAAAPVADVATPGPAPEPVVQAAPVAAAEPVVTASGYKKRVRGANVPRTEVLSARGNAEPEISLTEEAPTSTADSMRTMLSGLQAGTERGQAEARGENDTNNEEQR